MAHILLIEDDDGVRRMLGRFLRRLNHEVTEATHGGEGLKQAETTRFDLVVTDILMPETDGIETILGLRRGHPGLRIIAISGSSTSSGFNVLSAAAKLGADATLAKPFALDALAAEIERLVPSAGAPPDGKS